MQIERGDVLDLESEFFARKCASIAALVFLVWDSLAVCAKEYRFIFKSPTSKVKWLYLFARYFGIASQIIRFFLVTGPLSRLPVRPETCYKWFYFQIMTLVGLRVSIQPILVLRVYALYKKNLLVGCILSSAILLEMSLFTYSAVSAANLSEFDIACIVTQTPKGFIRIGGNLFVTQFTIWIFAMWKYRLGLQDGWANIPVVSMVMRDGWATFIAIIAMILIVVPFSVRVKNIAYIVVPVATSVASVIACRLILNMQDMRQTTPSVDVEFTSALEITILESRRALETDLGPGSNIP